MLWDIDGYTVPFLSVCVCVIVKGINRMLVLKIVLYEREGGRDLMSMRVLYL